jgi:inner membrane protein
MHLQTHLLASWSVGAALPERRDRRLVAWAGVLPDLDGLSVLWGVDAYGRWHHVLTHGLLAALATTALVALVARDRVRAALLALVAFHLHLALDLVGSGPGWVIVYLYPLSQGSIGGFPWAWELSSWPNLLFTAALVGVSLVTAVRWGRSFVESCAPVAVDVRFCALVVRIWARLSGAPSLKA